MIESWLSSIVDIVKDIYNWIVANPTLALWTFSVITISGVMIYYGLKSLSKSIVRGKYFRRVS